MLIEIIKRISRTTGNERTNYLVACDFCSTRIELSPKRFERSKRNFCNKSCYKTFIQENPEAWHGDPKHMNTPEAKAKSKASIQEKAAKGEWRPWLGKKHNDESKKKMSESALKDGQRAGEKNGMFGRHHSDEAKNKMSDSKSNLVLEGKFRAYGTCNKKGWYASTKMNLDYFFRSSWEESLMKHLDENVDVLSWQYEPVRIPYLYENNKRWYVPDFLVTRANGTKQIIEVKPREFTGAVKTLLKAEAARLWCAENNAEFITVTKQVLKEWGIIVK